MSGKVARLRVRQEWSTVDTTDECAQGSDYVRVFDTTLRDGEQSPGATLTSSEKLEIARALSRLGVDTIEAGFPAASPDDLYAVQQIAEVVGQTEVPSRSEQSVPTICGLARASEPDIQKAWAAVSHARFPRIHTFIATSPIHREHKLRLTREAILERVRTMVGYARSLCPDIEFSPEDAGRTESDFLHEVLSVAIEAGATTLNIPDTVGYTLPQEMGAIIAGIRTHVPNINQAVISVHCHNDLGLATANSLAAVLNGARQVEVAINGIGERAGNTALEEIVMALRTRHAALCLRTGVDSTQLTRTSRLVSQRTGMVVQPNKAIVGANAFAHEAGIHQDGMLKNADTYEIMKPESVGAAKTALVLGKHSGRHALESRLRELGHLLDKTALSETFDRFKALADRRKQITDADLEALVINATESLSVAYVLDSLQVSAGHHGLATATVRLRRPDGALATHASVGTGPVDAIYKAIDTLLPTNRSLMEYTVHSVTEGIDALGQVTVRVHAPRMEGRLNPQSEQGQGLFFSGSGAHTDVLIASAQAYLAAVNRHISALGGLKEEGGTWVDASSAPALSGRSLATALVQP